MDKYEQIALDVLEKVGGRENVTFATHCVTRLRLNVHDKDVIDLDAIKAIPGVLGAQWSGEQLQVIIGTTINSVYDAFVRIGGFEQQEALDENLDAEKQPLTVGSVFSSILDYISGSLTAIIPLIVGCGLVMALSTVLALTGLPQFGTESDVYRLLNFAGNVGFYFFPVFVGYSAAVKTGLNPIYGLLIGALFLHPTLTEIVEAGEAFTVFGIPMPLASYGSTVFPALLSVWVMTYVERFWKKVTPSAAYLLCVPALTYLTMLPLALCVLGPIGGIASNYLGGAFTWLHDTLGPIGSGVIAAAWPFVVGTGMHLPLVTAGLVLFAEQGYEAVIFPAAMMSTIVYAALSLGVFLRAKNQDDKSLGASCLFSSIIGGLGEPTIFGLIFRFRKLAVYTILGSFAGGVVVGLFNVRLLAMTISNFLFFLGFIGGDSMSNLINMLIACAVAFAVTLALVLAFGYDDEGKLFARSEA